jgi:hypothetical protein
MRHALDLRKSVLSLVFLLALASPLAAQIQIAGDLTVERSQRPGERGQAVIVVDNTGQEAVEVKVYQSDYRFFADGTIEYASGGEYERSNASWVTWSPSLLTIPPRESAQISVTIEVPVDTALPGTFWSLLLVEPVDSRETADVEPVEELEIRFRQVIRYGIQIVTNVVLPDLVASPALRFENPRFLREEGVRLLEADIVNSGDLWIRPTYFCEVYDPLGTMVARIELPQKRIYPGTSVRVSFRFPDLEAGVHKALVVADGGGDRLYGAQYTLRIE